MSVPWPITGRPDWPACGVLTRGDAGPLVPPAKYTVVVTPAGVLPMKSELTVMPDPRSHVSEADRQSRETAVESAYSLQQQLDRRTVRRSNCSVDNSARCARRFRVKRPRNWSGRRAILPRRLAQLSAAITGAARVQAAMDAYEGAPTAAQLRELNWAWEDAAAGVTALNQLIDESMPPLYGAAGASSRWTPLKPAPLPKR